MKPHRKNQSEDTKTIKKISREKKSIDVEKELRKQLEEKETEILQLKEKLDRLSKVEKIELNDEEMIAIMQLQRLKNIAQARELTLEESRKFEIFSKIKNSINKTPSIDTQYKKLPKDLTSNQLLQIANGKKSK